MAEQIRPGAALNDPFVQKELAREARTSRRMVWSSVLIVPAMFVLPAGLGGLITAKRQRHVLANYPWREYPCWFGRWVWEPGPRSGSVKEDLKNEIGMTRMQWKRDFTWIKIFDPASRQPLGIFQFSSGASMSFSGIAEDATRVQFAGDVNAAGILRGVEGTKAGTLALRRYLPQVLTNKYFDTMSPDRPAPFVPVAPTPPQSSPLQFGSNYGANYGPWIAESPQEPPPPVIVPKKR